MVCLRGEAVEPIDEALYRRTRWSILRIVDEQVRRFRWLHLGLRPRYLVLGNATNEMLLDAVAFQNRMDDTILKGGKPLDPYRIYGLKVAVLNEVVDSHRIEVCR